MITFSVTSMPITIPMPMQNNINPKSLPTSDLRLLRLYYYMQRLSGESRKSFCECSFSIFIHRFHHLKKCFSQNRMKNDLQNRNHIKNLCKSILIFDIYQFGSSVLNNKDSARGEFSGHTATAVTFCHLQMHQHQHQRIHLLEEE